MCDSLGQSLTGIVVGCFIRLAVGLPACAYLYAIKRS